MAENQPSAGSADESTSGVGCLTQVMAVVADVLGAAMLLILVFLFLAVLVGAALIMLGALPPALNAQTGQALAAYWMQVWTAITAPVVLRNLLAVLVLVALLGVFPITYYAYQTHRKDIKIQRLSDEFWLLGLIKRGEEGVVRDLYERVYSSRQYVLYILLILAVSLAVFWFYFPLSPLAIPAKGQQAASGLPVIVLGKTAPATSVTTAGVVSTTEIITPTTEVQPAVVISDAHSITVATILTTTAVISPAHPIAMTTVVTTTIPVSAEMTVTQVEPVVPEQADVLRLVFFAYLGAYLYSLIELIRRYNTLDLQPQVYASILVRMVAAIILVFVGAATIFNAPSSYQSPTAAPGYATIWLPGVVAFVIGAFPSRGIDWFRRLADPVLTGRTMATPNTLPIDNLQGMSPWHASRLEQLGIDDAQNLAGIDLRKLLLTTQFDTQVVVNWVDQAILYAKVGNAISKFREKNIPTFTALQRALKEIEPDATDANALAVQLGLRNFAELKAFARDSGFPNYNNLAEYYARSIQVTSHYAEEAQEAIIGQARFHNFDEAIRYGEDFLQLRLNAPDAGLLRTLGTAYYQRAMSRKRRGDREKADEDFELALQRFDGAIEIEPDSADAYYGRSLCWLEKPPSESMPEHDQWQKAINDCNAAIARNRSFAEAFNTLAIAYQKQGNQVLTQQHLEEALRLNDRLAAAYFNRGTLYNLRAQREDDAEQIRTYGANANADFEKAYLCGHNDKGGIHLGQGMAQLGIAGQEADDNRRKSILHRAAGHLTEAIGLLEEARLADAYLARAKVTINCGPEYYARAEKDLEWIIGRDADAALPITEQARRVLIDLTRLAAQADRTPS